MKRMILYTALAGMASFSVFAQSLGDTFIKIQDSNMFSRCFADCDADGNGIVTYVEAEATTKLMLDKGGRENVIDDYGFLKCFPNIMELSVGNTTVESIDLRCCPKLERLNLTNGLWIRDVTLALGCNPQITFPAGNGDIVIHRSDVRCESETFFYSERLEHELFPCYLVSTDGEKFGIYNNNSLVVPCSYTKLEALRIWHNMKKARKQKKVKP
jgi:hypothetical protein